MRPSVRSKSGSRGPRTAWCGLGSTMTGHCLPSLASGRRSTVIAARSPAGARTASVLRLPDMHRRGDPAEVGASLKEDAKWARGMARHPPALGSRQATGLGCTIQSSSTRWSMRIGRSILVGVRRSQSSHLVVQAAYHQPIAVHLQLMDPIARRRRPLHGAGDAGLDKSGCRTGYA